MHIEALVLAAGSSLRMGSTQKLLCRIQDRSLIRHVVDALRGVGLEPLIVLGPFDQELQSELADCKTVINPDHELGMGNTLAFGVKHLPEFDSVLITLGDHLGLCQLLLKQMVHESGSGSILRARYPGSPIPHPVLFPVKYRSELESLTGDQGAKSLLEKHKESVREIQGKNAPMDIDDPGDLRRALDQWK